MSAGIALLGILAGVAAEPRATVQSRAAAQRRTVSNASPAAVAFQGSPRVSFEISPLVQQVSGRRGQKLPFSFQVRGLDQPQSLRIRAVSLKQQLNGLIVADEENAPPAAIHLTEPTQLDLKPEQVATIRGHVEVPLSSAPFHAFGVLVTDMGRPLSGSSPTAPAGTAVQVRFVTQYLLRVEVRVTGGFGEKAKELRVESARLAERDGSAVAEVEIANPTEAAVEFQLYCRLLRDDGRAVTRQFGLSHPVRANRPEPERYESRVFAGSRVRVEAPLPEPAFPGEYRLEVAWVSQRRKCGDESFAATVREGDFPAQEAQFARVGDMLSIAPAQLGLSVGQGGNRRLPVRFTNDGVRPLRVELAVENFDGTAADWALVSPGTFLLPADCGRNVLVAVKPGGEIRQHRYGALRVTVANDGTNDETRRLPLAVVAALPAEPQLDVGAVRWAIADGRPAFVVPVENRGVVHVSIKGRLTTNDGPGRRLDIPGGFDHWLLSGERDEIAFPAPHWLGAGTYRVKVQLETGTDHEPVTLDQVVQVSPRATLE